MRNIKKHPITLNEIVGCLDSLAAEISKRDIKEGRVGNMQPGLLKEASKIVMRAGFVTSNIKV